VSIVELQKRARRLGEIRLGDTVTQNGKTRPVSLDTFRLTSVARGLLQQAADLWGGEVVPWDNKWQLVTDVSELPVIIPPQDPDNVTWYEAWTAGGLQRRCDGETIVNREGNLPCVCNPEHRECSMVTRIQVMLPDLPDVGVWVMSSTGYYAASEMAMSIQIVMDAAQRTGHLPDAVLAIEHREVKRPGEPTKKFVVPVLRFADPLATFLPDRTPSLASTTSARPLPPGGPSGPAGRGEGEGTVQHVPHPPLPANPSAPTVPDGISQEPREAILSEGPVSDTGDFDVWSDLLTHLEGDATEGTMAVIEARIRKLYRMMHSVNLWPEDAIHAALAKHYQVAHVGDLRKAELQQFATQSFDAARQQVADAK